MTKRLGGAIHNPRDVADTRWSLDIRVQQTIGVPEYLSLVTRTVVPVRTEIRSLVVRSLS